jgi:hypothetical protein
MMTTTELSKQLDSLHPGLKPRATHVLIRNMTAPHRKATIVAAGVHFFYQIDQKADDVFSNYLAGPVLISLASGASAPFSSSDPRRTVVRLASGVTVRFGESDDQLKPEYRKFFAEYDPAKDGIELPAIVEVEFELRTKSVVSGQLQTASDWFELRRVVRL